jgi:hypothetical protein
MRDGTEGFARGPEEEALGRLVAEPELLYDDVPEVLEGIRAGVHKGLERPVHEENLDALRLPFGRGRGAPQVIKSAPRLFSGLKKNNLI